MTMSDNTATAAAAASSHAPHTAYTVQPATHDVIRRHQIIPADSLTHAQRHYHASAAASPTHRRNAAAPPLGDNSSSSYAYNSSSDNDVYDSSDYGHYGNSGGGGQHDHQQAINTTQGYAPTSQATHFAANTPQRNDVMLYSQRQSQHDALLRHHNDAHLRQTKQLMTPTQTRSHHQHQQQQQQQTRDHNNHCHMTNSHMTSSPPTHDTSPDRIHLDIKDYILNDVNRGTPATTMTSRQREDSSDVHHVAGDGHQHYGAVHYIANRSANAEASI